MKNLLLLALSCMAIFQLQADTIGGVSYNLPAAAKEWKVVHKVDNEKGTTLIYAPEMVEGQNPQGSFGLNYNKLPASFDDVVFIKTGLEAGLLPVLPNITIDVKELEKNDRSLLYEWTASMNGKEKIHGWGRAFSTKAGSVVMGYQTQNIPNVEEERAVWVAMLKSAVVQ